LLGGRLPDKLPRVKRSPPLILFGFHVSSKESMIRGVLVALACAFALPAHAADGLAAHLDAVLASSGLRGARVAALVVERDGGRELYARDPDRPMIPASNLKLLTALAALEAFGPTHQFRTELFSDTAPDAHGTVARLMLLGSGDPALTSEDLWRLAADVRRAGVERVRDGLLLDDGAFDHERWHPSWGAVSARAYHAPISALTVNYGALGVTLIPGAAPGDPVRVMLDPPVAFFRVTNRATTGTRRVGSALEVERRAGDGVENVLVSGVAPAGSAMQTVYRSVLDPTRYFGAVLRMQLEANGVHVGADTATGPVPPEAVPLLGFEGRSLAETVRLFLKYSNNEIGEGLVKALAARSHATGASWKEGIDAVRVQLEQAGLDTARVTQVDGSGLSYENRVPPRVLVAALRIGTGSFRYGPELLAALPIAAADGTLQKRAAGAANAVRAKTGLLTGVTSLSGLAQCADGRVVVFSVLVNGFRGSAESAMDALDHFVSVLAASRAEPH
jgi:D-alanyl-D-alanine carboxypeptidase/D-alanyl-D-alanine-endopeptidase (penicillin-binding protein 4)